MKTKLYSSSLARRAQTGLLLFSLASFMGAVNLASGASPSELLEKGIYSEETKGDLDGAMQLYQQVVAEGKAGQAVAAQAQYRLGICYYKKKNYAEASAALEKLIREYPEQKDLVAMANEYLARAASLLPAPWTDGEELRLDIKFPTGFRLGMVNYTVDAGQINGQQIWRLSSHLYAGVQQISRVEVEADSFKPIHCRWKHTLIGDADTVFAKDYATLKLVGKDEVKKVDLQGVVYDNEEVVQLMRRLPLAANYKKTLNVFTGLGGGNIIPLGIEVARQEKVTVPAGTFDCYRVDLSLKQSFWYSADPHRYLVKFEAGGVIAELVSITQRKAGAPVQYKDSALGFSLTAPADWIFFRPDKQDEKGKELVLVLDPDGTATSMVTVQSASDLKPEAKKSPRAWAETRVAEGSKIYKNLQVRSESWSERTVAGRPGVSLVGDFEEGKEKKVAYALFIIGNTNAVESVLLIPEKDFEAFRPKFEALVDSYRGK